MKAQELYDLREATAFASGTELQDFFKAQTGDYSPSGRVEINGHAAHSFVAQCLDEIDHNSPTAFAAIKAMA